MTTQHFAHGGGGGNGGDMNDFVTRSDYDTRVGRVEDDTRRLLVAGLAAAILVLGAVVTSHFRLSSEINAAETALSQQVQSVDRSLAILADRAQRTDES